MAGTSYAPISAILILFEFTGNYDLILPVMLAAILVEPARPRAPPLLDLHRVAARQGDRPALRMEEAVLAGLKAET